MKNSLITSLLLVIALLLPSCGITDNPPESSPIPDVTSKEPTVSAVTYGKFTAEVLDYEYNIPERYYSEGIKNIVRRARQVSDLHWIPLSNVVGFNGDTVFESGKEVIGIPYGQPVYNGSFVGYDVTIDDFASATKKLSGKFYSDSARYEEIAPYYSLDCSTLVCYAWAHPKRMIAALLTKWGDYCGSTVNDIQVGDALIAVGDITHAVLVTGAKENANGQVVWVEITEETPPLPKVTRYGDGELFSISELSSDYFEKGYGVYRNTDFRDATPYVHSCASPLDGQYCYDCTEYGELNLNEDSDSIEIKCSYKSENAVAFAYTVESRDYGILKYRTPSSGRTELLSSPASGNAVYYIPSGTTITSTEIQTDKSGKLWGKVRISGKCGWVCLSDCTKLGGSMERSELKMFKSTVNDNISSATVPVDEKDLFDGCIVHVYAVTSDNVLHEVGKIAVKKR